MLTSCDVPRGVLRAEHVARNEASRVSEDTLEGNADGPLVLAREIVREPAARTVQVRGSVYDGGRLLRTRTMR